MGRVDWVLEAHRSRDDRCRSGADATSSNRVRLTNERELGGRGRDDAKRRSHYA